MRKIVSVIKPFILKQNLFVYEDGNKIDLICVSIETIENDLVDIAKKYEATNIELVGSKNYIQGIKRKIEEIEMTKYNEKILNIKIIGA